MQIMASRALHQQIYIYAGVIIALYAFVLSPAHAIAQHFQCYMCESDTFIYPAVYDGAFYRIDFGDGTADSGQHQISHRYAGNGSYVLKIKRSFNNTNTTTGCTAHVGTLPVEGFTSKAHCSRVDFNNACPDTIIIIGGWAWDFGDGTTSLEKSPQHLYRYPGTYSVTLTPAHRECSSGKSAKIITITLPVDAGYDAHVNGNDALFVPHNTSASGYHWNFGDQDTTDSISPVHTFKNNGKYPVSLLTVSNTGCVSYFVDTLSVDNAGIQPVNNNSTVFQAYPNPFREQLDIHYELTAPHLVTLKLYDATGRLVANIQDGLQHAGVYNIAFQASLSGLKSGFYLLKGNFGEVYLTQRILLQE
jgi:hypothetical protein